LEAKGWKIKTLKLKYSHLLISFWRQFLLFRRNNKCLFYDGFDAKKSLSNTKLQSNLLQIFDKKKKQHFVFRSKDSKMWSILFAFPPYPLLLILNTQHSVRINNQNSKPFSQIHNIKLIKISRTKKALFHKRCQDKRVLCFVKASHLIEP